MQEKRLGLYLHIPFCRSKCNYCDFCSLPNRSERDFQAYTEALCRDLAAWSGACRDYTVDTVYFGGGTPTLLPSAMLIRLLETLAAEYRLAEHTEITVECNPATATKETLSQLRQAGFNRLSIGLQSANDGELRALGRAHTVRDFEATFADARAVGFSNISADVMMGIPEQTPASWQQTLSFLCGLRPEHISAYGLTVEEETPFGRMGERLVLPSEEQSEQMYFSGIELLREHGYAQYEISNFATEGFASRHNLKYWRCEEYLGFGPAAHSDFGGCRFGNSRDVDAYMAGKNIRESEEYPDGEERLLETVMLGMRLAEGIDLDAIAARFGEEWASNYREQLVPYLQGGFVRATERGYAFTPKGMYVSNTILSSILAF